MKRAQGPWWLLLLAACGADATATPAASSAPRKLVPRIDALKDQAATLPAPLAEGKRRELQELLDIYTTPESADPRMVARAERTLLESPGTLSLVEAIFAASEPQARSRLAYLCGKLGPVAQFPLLLRLRYENHPETVAWIADALAACGNEAGLLWLSDATQREDTADLAGQLAVARLRALGEPLPEQPSWEQLRAALTKRSEAWRMRGGSAVQDPAALAEIEARIAAHLAATEGKPLRPVDEARFVLTRIGVLALPQLRAALTAEEPYLRTMALQVLAELGPVGGAVADAVLPLLDDPLTAPYAIRALGEFGVAAHAAVIQPRLRAADLDVRCAAAQALGLLGCTSAAPELRALVSAPAQPMDLRVSAAFGLLCLGPEPGALALLTEREQRKDYSPPALQQLRKRLADRGR